METITKVKPEFNSLNTVLEALKKGSSYDCKKEYDSWDVRTDKNGQMEQCIIVKKSAMHGMKLYFEDENFMKMNYIIPNKVMNAYFGKSVKRHKSIVEVITGKISQAVLSGSQKKAFEEMGATVTKIVT